MIIPMTKTIVMKITYVSVRIIMVIIGIAVVVMVIFAMVMSIGAVVVIVEIVGENRREPNVAQVECGNLKL